MSTFATLNNSDSPVRIILIGAGGMGKKWLSLLSESPDVELVGLVDLDLAVAETALRDVGITSLPIGTSLTEIAATTGAQAVVNVTIPAAHHPVNMEALFAGLPVLCEKPVAPTVSQGLSLAAASEVSGQLLMISQSRRYYRHLADLKERVTRLGDIGLVSTNFFRAPHFGGFREEMNHVLLVDMAIHAFDVARYLLDAEPVSVYCDEFNPSWSWYAADAATTAIFELSNGARYTYVGSWCSAGLQTSWNGDWRISGELGTATWDGENEPDIEMVDNRVVERAVSTRETPEQIAGSLAEFILALRTGEMPSGEVHGNVLSLAMVEAAVRSAEIRQRVTIEQILNDAHAAALTDERLPEVAATLMEWTSPRHALGRLESVQDTPSR